MTELAFVLARGQNSFFVEVVEALRDELDQLGVRSSLELDGFPQPRGGLINVLLPPHEYFALRGDVEPPEPSLLRRSLFICAEQPGSQWFHDNIGLGKEAGAVLDINAWAVQEWIHHGVAAEHLPLGWTRRWDRSPFNGERDIDVAFLGSHTDRRARYLAGYAPSLWQWRAHLLLSDNGRPNPAAGPDFVAGEPKRDLLARSRVLLNLHASDLPYFEGLRIVESIHCGAVVLSEHSALTTPLAPGRDYLSAGPESLMLVAQDLLEDEDGRQRFATEALERLREDSPLRASAERLVAVAEEVDRTAPIDARMPRPAPQPAANAAPAGTVDEDPLVPALRRTLKLTRLDLIRSRRRLEQLELELTGQPAVGIEVAGTMRVHPKAATRVSVIVTLYDYEDYIEAALDSVAASTFRAFELIVVDDASKDASLSRALSWCERHPEIASTVLHQRSNRGLPHARNAGLEVARGELAFVLDADNAVYPHCLGRLVEALDAHPDAVFAYGMAERYDARGPEGLLSVFGWDPTRLREVNYIDAMAMIRVEALRELEGYTDEIQLYGWEDYDLWCKVAERGWYGHVVREILARYRVTPNSMLASVTTLSGTDAYVALAARHPKLMAGVRPPP